MRITCTEKVLGKFCGHDADYQYECKDDETGEVKNRVYRCAKHMAEEIRYRTLFDGEVATLELLTSTQHRN